MGKGTKRKKASYYANSKPKKARRFVLEAGLKGFICTCNNKEKECVRESYNILNEYAEKIYGEERKETSKSSDDEDSDDIDKALDEEIKHLKADREKEPSQRRFQVVDSGAKNCIFIRTTVDDPVQVVTAILKDLEATKKQKSRFLLRMLPVEVTCKAWPSDITEAVNKLLDKHFLGGEEKTFSVVLSRRNNQNVPRDEVIKEIAAGVRMRNPLHVADLKTPQFSIIVEIIRNICCLAVVPDYYKYRRYNLLEVCAVQHTTDVCKKDLISENEASGECDEQTNEKVCEPIKTTDNSGDSKQISDVLDKEKPTECDHSIKGEE